LAPEVRALAPDNSSASSHISMGGVIFAGAGSPSSLSARSDALNQGLTLVHFSAQPEPFLTQNTP